MKVQSLLIIGVVVIFAIGIMEGRIASGDELNYRVDSIKCGCCDILEKGDTVLKVAQCMGQPDYKDIEEVPANPFGDSEIAAIAEFWYYKKDSWTYRIKIENGLVRGIQEMPPE